MAIFFEQSQRRFIYVHLTAASEFVAPPTVDSYACLLWNAAPHIEPTARVELVRRLIGSGCTYIVAAGIDCEEWHDTADREFVALDLPKAEYERRFLMSTWHTDESVDEVAFYFTHLTFPYPDSGLDEYAGFLVLQVGGDQQLGERLQEAIRSQASDS